MFSLVYQLNKSCTLLQSQIKHTTSPDSQYAAVICAPVPITSMMCPSLTKSTGCGSEINWSSTFTLAESQRGEGVACTTTWGTETSPLGKTSRFTVLSQGHVYTESVSQFLCHQGKNNPHHWNKTVLFTPLPIDRLHWASHKSFCHMIRGGRADQSLSPHRNQHQTKTASFAAPPTVKWGDKRSTISLRETQWMMLIDIDIFQSAAVDRCLTPVSPVTSFTSCCSCCRNRSSRSVQRSGTYFNLTGTNTNND